mmetsp:Transcript_101699/g.323140  ORF Transcript_101699/g.323140 Transcript_101699/m.323140 type:complete len:255 (-) Transcript_101699:595-1359(-)
MRSIALARSEVEPVAGTPQYLLHRGAPQPPQRVVPTQKVRVEDLHLHQLLEVENHDVEPTRTAPLWRQCPLLCIGAVGLVAQPHHGVRVGRRRAEERHILSLKAAGLHYAQPQQALRHRAVESRDVDLLLSAPNPVNELPVREDEVLADEVQHRRLERRADPGPVSQPRSTAELPLDLRRRDHEELYAGDNRKRGHQGPQDNAGFASNPQSPNAKGDDARDLQANLHRRVPAHAHVALDARMLLRRAATDVHWA